MQVIPIKVFYHCWLIGNWRQVVKEQIELLIVSDLYRESEDVVITVVGTDKDVEELTEGLKRFPKFNIKVIPKEKVSLEERNCLQLIYDYSIECKELKHIVYFHTKGVSHIFSRHNAKPIQTQEWRRLLDYHIIKKWKESRSALKFGDISGALEMVRTPDSYKTEFSKLKLKNNFIFRGNYWWTTTKYIKRLPDPKSLTSDRYINEDWIGLVPELKAVSVYSDNHDYYHMVANVNEYTIRNKNIWNIYTVDNIKGTVNNKEVQVTFKEP